MWMERACGGPCTAHPVPGWWFWGSFGLMATCCVLSRVRWRPPHGRKEVYVRLTPVMHDAANAVAKVDSCWEHSAGRSEHSVILQLRWKPTKSGWH